jgi:hypothetical protein
VLLAIPLRTGVGDDEVLAMDSTVIAAIIGAAAVIVAAVIGHRAARSGPPTVEPVTSPPEDASGLTPPSAAYVEVGPLTLGATLNTPPDVESYPPAYPTGPAGAHFVFPLHNPNRVAFIVVGVQVEVHSYQEIELEQLNHGVGATDTIRRFKVQIEPHAGRYAATYGTHEQFSEYVRVLPREDDVFDVEVTTDAEGLFELRVHVKGTLDGKPFDVSPRSCSIVFFDRHSNYLVQRSDGSLQRFDEYIAQLSQSNRQLDVYLAVD